MRLRATGRKQVKRETITVNTYKNLPASTGFTLTEVLVALLVLGIGLLGLAALQARGVKFNHDANARSQATLLAYQIMDQMRADAASMASYCTDSTACPSTYATPSSDPASACNLASSSVQNTIDCWMAAVREVLPAGRSGGRGTPRASKSVSPSPTGSGTPATASAGSPRPGR